MPTDLLKNLGVRGKPTPHQGDILTKEALAFLVRLHREFNSPREMLLQKRAERQKRFDSGELPDFLRETASIRQGDWRVASAPKDLNDRRVEITGPVERKMMINALNSGAKVFMADFEDSLSPTWENVIEGQWNLQQAVRRRLCFTAPEGKAYTLHDKTATLLVRPRGWHLVEKHVVDGEDPLSASLFDFGLYFFHNASELLRRQTGPYFYLPKLESHLEARLWNDVFNFAQDALKIPRGTIRATVLIETIPAAFEMEEILYELRDHVSGLNAGRWDYIFSMIKKFRNSPRFILPDRAQVTMAVPFMRAYTDLLVKTCHLHGAHAIGGMAAFIPSRKDSAINEVALAKVREDKERESGAGFDGTWVAHPDLVAVAQKVFDKVLGTRSHQKERQREEVKTSAGDLLDTRIPDSTITENGFRNNLSVSLQYLERWLGGVGAAGIFNLMEDVATAEISRAQLWQWLHHKVPLNDGVALSPDLYVKIRDEELEKLGDIRAGRFGEAVEILDRLVLHPDFPEFLTITAYRYLAQFQKGA